MGKSAQLQNLLQGYQCNQLSSNFCAYFITLSGNTSGDKVGQARNCRGGINALARTGTILSSYLRNRNTAHFLNGIELKCDYIIFEYDRNQIIDKYGK